MTGTGAWGPLVDVDRHVAVALHGYALDHPGFTNAMKVVSAVLSPAAWWFVLTPVLSWGVPFLALMPRNAKRNPQVLQVVCMVVLAARWLDLYVVAAPFVCPAPQLGLLELLVTAGLGGVFFLGLTRSLASAPLVARNDPFLAESLHHHA